MANRKNNSVQIPKLSKKNVSSEAIDNVSSLEFPALHGDEKDCTVITSEKLIIGIPNLK